MRIGEELLQCSDWTKKAIQFQRFAGGYYNADYALNTPTLTTDPNVLKCTYCTGIIQNVNS